jgi:hypothetical protein
VGSGRKRVNILGAYCPDDQEYLDLRLTRDNVNGEQVVNLLRLLRATHPETERFVLYLDRARYYGSPGVAQLDRFIRLTEDLARAALLSAGFRRHARGAWRKRRTMPTTTTTPPEIPAPPVLDPDEAGERAAEEQIQELVRRAERCDASVMPRLCAILDRAPSRWKRYAGLGERVEALWLGVVAGQDLVLLESWGRRLAEMRAELAGDDPSPLVRLLADRACATWLQLQAADAGAAIVQGGEAAEEATALRRQNAANKRHLQALRTLVAVQRLLRPSVSPAEVASRLGGRGPAGVRRAAPSRDGVGVLN